ncbi:MAG: adenosylcobinamide-GDP ribazoletransferase [Ramlibacter sp.]
MTLPRERLQRFLRRWLQALRGATRLPLPPSLAPWATAEEPAAAVAPHLPGVGLLVGAAACVVFALVSLPLPDTTASALVAALLATVATMLLTGAADEQGLARWIDGWGTQQGLATAAMLAVGLAVATKVALLAVMAGQSAGGVLATLLAGHVVSRFWPLAGEERVDREALLVGGLWCLPALLLMWLAGGAGCVLAALVASGLACLVLRRHRHPWPADADDPAATQQVCEVAFYLGAAFALR